MITMFNEYISARLAHDDHVRIFRKEELDTAVSVHALETRDTRIPEGYRVPSLIPNL